MKSKSGSQFRRDHGVSKPTFYADVRSGDLRVFKPGKETRVSEEAERDYIRKCEKRYAEGAPARSQKARELVAGRINR